MNDRWSDLSAEWADDLDADVFTLRAALLAGEWERALGLCADLSVGIRCAWRLDDKLMISELEPDTNPEPTQGWMT